MTFRSKSAGRVLEEIDQLDRRHRPEYIEMVDNILDMKYFRELIPELARRRLKLRLFYETKANLTKEQVRAMRDAGIATIQPGIESLDTEVLRLMRKGTSALQNLQLLKWCKEYDIVAYWNLIYGFPGEDPAAYDSMASIIEFVHHLRPPHAIGPIRLDRFSPNFVDAAALGIAGVRPDRNYSYIYDLTDDELDNLAYYFEYDYDDGRDPEAYVGGARKAVLRWHENSDSRGLVYADHGDDLAVWDLRPKAKRTLTILTADQRAVFLYCDQHRSLEQIRSFLRDRQSAQTPIQPFLDDLVAHRLMICLDGRYLSLAVPAAASAAARPQAAAQQIAAACSETASRSGGKTFGRRRFGSRL